MRFSAVGLGSRASSGVASRGGRFETIVVRALSPDWTWCRLGGVMTRAKSGPNSDTA